MSQRKSLPWFKAFDHEDHYQAIQQGIHATARRNPRFDNMVLLIQVDIKVNAENEEDIIELNDELSIRERSVVSFYQRPNTRMKETRQVINKKRR